MKIKLIFPFLTMLCFGCKGSLFEKTKSEILKTYDDTYHNYPNRIDSIHQQVTQIFLVKNSTNNPLRDTIIKKEQELISLQIDLSTSLSSPNFSDEDTVDAKKTRYWVSFQIKMLTKNIEELEVLLRQYRAAEYLQKSTEKSPAVCGGFLLLKIFNNSVSYFFRTLF